MPDIVATKFLSLMFDISGVKKYFNINRIEQKYQVTPHLFVYCQEKRVEQFNETCANIKRNTMYKATTELVQFL